jgi:L-seryl-tRNA(Ser) seleniumtransferase
MVGSKELILRLNQNHLQRALRCGKLTLAALEAILKLYHQSPDITQAIPTLKAFTRTVDEIRATGEQVLPKIQAILGEAFSLSLEHSTAQVGSGALPTEELPTVVITVSHEKEPAHRVAEKFRRAHPPIIGRIRDDRFLLDLRSIFDPEDLIPNFADGGRRISSGEDF